MVNCSSVPPHKYLLADKIYQRQREIMRDGEHPSPLFIFVMFMTRSDASVACTRRGDDSTQSDENPSMNYKGRAGGGTQPKFRLKECEL